MDKGGKDSSDHSQTGGASRVLLLIDVINDFDFPEKDQLLSCALETAQRIASLKRHLRKSGVPAIYVNDNFGRWKSDFAAQIDHCLKADGDARAIVELLRPEEDDYFVLKPMHSGFFSTNLEILLRHLKAETLILTGFAGNICVLFTANDAYMREYKISVPSDCIASNTEAENQFSLEQMERILKADVRPAAEFF